MKNENPCCASNASGEKRDQAGSPFVLYRGIYRCRVREQLGAGNASHPQALPHKGHLVIYVMVDYRAVLRSNKHEQSYRHEPSYMSVPVRYGWRCALR